MGNNAMEDMMMRLTKRLMINDGGSGSKLEFYLSNSILLVVRDSTPDAMSHRLHAIACNVTEIACNHMQCCRDHMQLHAMLLRSHAIACDVMRSQKKTFLSSTVRVLENTLGMRSGTESLPKEFLHNNCEQIFYHYFFDFLKKEEMRSGTHFTQQTCFFLFEGRKKGFA